MRTRCAVRVMVRGRTTEHIMNSSTVSKASPSVALTGQRAGLRAPVPEQRQGALRLAASRQHLAPKGTADPPRWASADARKARLTRREWEVLSVLVTGVSNGEIAARLHISPHTVANHLANIFDKLEIHNRTQAAVRALGMGPAPLAPRANLSAQRKPDTD